MYSKLHTDVSSTSTTESIPTSTSSVGVFTSQTPSSSVVTGAADGM